MNRKDKKLLLLILLTFLIILNFILSTTYRNYIYDNSINDFGLADVGYNIFAVLTISITSWLGLFQLTQNKLIDILLFTLAYVIWEFLTLKFSSLGTFDKKDLMALCLSGIITLLLLYFVDKFTFQTDWLKIKSYLNKYKSF